MFTFFGRFSYRFRWPIVAVWTIALVAGLVAASRLGDVLQGGGFRSPDTPSAKAATLAQDKFGQGATSLTLVFSDPSLDARSDGFQAKEAQAVAGLTPQSLRGLRKVVTYATSGMEDMVSKDGHSSLAVVEFDESLPEVQNQVGEVRRLLRDTGLEVEVTGEPAVHYDLSHTSESDLRRVEMYAMPVALIVLVLVFGSLVAAALPVVTAAAAVMTTLGAVFVLAHPMDMSIFVMNVATLLGLAVGIDYALFMVARFREELSAGRAVEEAVFLTVTRAGRSVFFSGLGVAVGILGLTLFPFPALRSLGIGGGLVVLFSVLSALTLLPALLAILGPRVNALRVLKIRPPHQSRFWMRWADGVLRRPWLATAAALVVVGVVVWPVVKMQTNVATAEALPPGSESRVGYEKLAADFGPGVVAPLDVVLTWTGDPTALNAAHLLAFYDYGQRLTTTEGVGSVTSVVNLPGIDTLPELAAFWKGVQAYETGQKVESSGSPPTPEQIAQIKRLIASTTAPGAVLLRVTPAMDPSSIEARKLAERIRAVAPPQGMTSHVAGTAASNADFFNGVGERFPWVVAYVVVATYIILLLMLRSVLLPLQAIVVNACTIMMSWGVMVFVFQDGRWQGWLHYTSVGTIDSVMPIVMFCALFGIAMDYEVFLLTRMHEAWLETHDNRRAIATGLVSSGRVVVSAAALVVVVAGSFAFTSIAMTKMLGVGIAVAIALDAVLIRMLLVPAVMDFCGRANWWLPRWLDRILPYTGHD
jgi:putative drug exporter of the RND superfamily